VKMIQYVYKYSNKLTKLGAKVGLCLGKKIFSYTVLPKVKKNRKKFERLILYIIYLCPKKLPQALLSVFFAETCLLFHSSKELS